MVAYLSKQVGNRLFRSPLAGIPGPWLAKITILYKEFYAARGLLPLFLKRLHDEYGPVVQIGPNHVSCITKESTDLIYKTYAFEKGSFYRAFGYGGTNIFSAM